MSHMDADKQIDEHGLYQNVTKVKDPFPDFLKFLN